MRSVGLDSSLVVEVVERDGTPGGFLRVMVESPPRVEAYRTCGVVAHSHGRREVRLVDAPCFDPPAVVTQVARTPRPRRARVPFGRAAQDLPFAYGL